MAIFKKRADPLSERARALTSEIAALEAQIRQLDTELHQSQAQPRLRSTARPLHSAAPASAPAREPVFEPVDHGRVKSHAAPQIAPSHFDDLGVRRFEFTAAWRRLKNNFQGPPANNPKLVNYLAAGSIQGLRPMRYEKRVARNRVLLLAAILFVALWGIWAFLFRHR
jgi:hypothetical protein